MRKPKNTKYTFRINEEDLKAIKKSAKRAKMHTTDYVTKLALKESIVVADGYKELNYEINRLGNNLNQIAKLSNSGMIDKDRFNQMQEDFNKAICTLSKLSEVFI